MNTGQLKTIMCAMGALITWDDFLKLEVMT